MKRLARARCIFAVAYFIIILHVRLESKPLFSHFMNSIIICKCLMNGGNDIGAEVVYNYNQAASEHYKRHDRRKQVTGITWSF